MKLTLPFLLLLLISFTTTAQTWIDAQEVGNKSKVVMASTTDQAGNLFIAGIFRDSLKLGNQHFSCSSACGFISKLDKQQRVKWYSNWEGFVYPRFMTTDKQGNVYMAGVFAAGKPAVFGAVTVTCVGYYDAFIVKYDSTGAVQWVKTGGSASIDTSYSPQIGIYDEAKSVAVDAYGKVYVAGQVTDTAYFDSVQFVPDVQRRGFLSCYSSTGVLQWVRDAGAYEAVTADAYGNIYTKGIDGTVEKYDSTGTLLWHRPLDVNGTFKATQTDGSSITTDAQGNIFVTGSFQDSIRFSNGASFKTNTGVSAFVAQLDSSGNVHWASALHNRQDPPHNMGMVEGLKVVTDSRGNVYVGGWFSHSLVAGADTLYGQNSSLDIFVARYSPAGSLKGVATGGSGYTIDLLHSLNATVDSAIIVGQTQNGWFGSHFVAGERCFIARLRFGSITGLSEAAAASEGLRLYPSPASRSVTVAAPAGAGAVQVRLYNLQGQLVLEQALPSETATLQLPGLPAGVYLLRAQGAKQAWQQKLVVE